MGKSKTRKGSVLGTVETDAIVKSEPVDGYGAANARIDSLYQEIENTEPDPAKKLTALSSAIRLKIALGNYKMKSLARG